MADDPNLIPVGQTEEPPPATPAAQAVADEHGVDLTEVKPTGASGKVTKEDVLTHVEKVASKFWHYCLEENHPGVPNYQSEPLDVARIFATDTNDGAPVCPSCNREVSAVPCEGPDIPPASIITQSERYGRFAR